MYATWGEVQKLKPKRCKGFHSVEAAEEWLGLHEEPAASVSRSGKGVRYYAIGDLNGWGVYTDWAAVQRLRPKRCKGFDSLDEARDWLEQLSKAPKPKRSKTRKRRKQKSKTWYAVSIGKRPGVYSSWIECKEQVWGVDESLHEAFENKEEAVAFVRAHRNHHVGAKPRVRSRRHGEQADGNGGQQCDAGGRGAWQCGEHARSLGIFARAARAGVGRSGESASGVYPNAVAAAGAGFGEAGRKCKRLTAGWGAHRGVVGKTEEDPGGEGC